MQHRIIRRSLIRDPTTNRLIDTRGARRPISVVYFRAAYVPSHFPTEAEWAARELIELSDAIKCPWVGLQLVNTKKMQQVIATGDVVAHYLPRLAADTDATFAKRVVRVKNVFAALYSLGNDNLCESQW